MLRLPEVDIEPAKVDWHGLPQRFMNDGELEIIIALLQRIKPRRMAEFGVNEGRTARLILENVHGIEDYLGFDVPRSYRPARGFQAFEIPTEPGRYVKDDPRFRLSVFPRGTFDVRPSDLGTIDAVFIDGDHGREAIENDTVLAYACVRPGGLIIWHDYHEIGTTDVADVLHDLMDQWHLIRNVRGTWIAYEYAPQPGALLAQTA